MYSSMLDPYEPPRPRPVYDSPQAVSRPRSLLYRLAVRLTKARARGTAVDAGCPAGRTARTCPAGETGALVTLMSPGRARD
jgi:hypothetical protein